MAKCKKVDQNYLDRIYVPNPGQVWREQEDGSIVMEQVHRGFFHWIAQRFFHRPRISYISLDGYGSVLWKAMDGKHTVYDLVERMKQKYPEERERMLDRVVTFIGILEMHHFIVK